MKRLAKCWKPAAFLGLTVAFGLSNAQPARAFTLVELLVISSLELLASESATVAVSNTSANDIHVVALAFNDRGTMFKQRGSDATPITVAPNATFEFSVRAPATGNLGTHELIELDTANAAVVDVVGRGLNTGQIISIMPGGGNLPAVQHLPAVQLIAGQSALVKVTNATPNDASATINIYRGTGALFETVPTGTIPPNGTFTKTVTNPFTGNLTLFGTITWSEGGVGVSDVMTLNAATGQVTAILPYIEINGSGG